MTNKTTDIVEVVEDGTMGTEVKLKRPIVFDGETIEVLILNFESLTGADIEKAELQFIAENTQNAVVPLKEMSKPFLAIVAAKAAKVNVQLIRSLSASDYAKITTRTMTFLLAGK